MINYFNPATLEEFKNLYNKEYRQELESSDIWIKWCARQTPPDTHGMNFHQGLRSALVFNNIKMEQLFRTLETIILPNEDSHE